MSFSTHLALSNFGAGAAAGAAALDALKIEAVGAVAAVAVAEAADFCELSSTAVRGEEETLVMAVEAVSAAGLVGPAGEEKKEVMDALALGFLAVEVARSAALRLRGVAMLEIESYSSVNSPETVVEKEHESFKRM